MPPSEAQARSSAARLRGPIALLTSLLLCACEPGPWAELEEALDSFVPDTVDGYVFDLTANGENQLLVSGGDMRVRQKVPIASASKAPSAAAILTLVDDGLLDLDQPVGAYLEGSIDWPADKQAITPRMLLNHSSGLATAPACLNDAADTTMQACVQEIADLPLSFEPGTAFAYGGGSYQVAGYIATLLSGLSWHDFVDAVLVQPLGMRSFFYYGDGNPRVAGGAVTQAQDYRRFQLMILNEGLHEGVPVLSSAMVAEMSHDQIEGLPKAFTPLDEQAYPGYAFGWWIASPALHPGSAGPELSDPGALGSVPWIDLGLRYTALLLLIASGEDGLAMWDTARPIIIDELNSDEARAL